MDLISVSRRFDTAPMWDAYTGMQLAARCQIRVWDNPRRDGLTSIRRTFSMSASAELPARRTVVAAGLVWIISRLSNPDTWESDISRVGYVAQTASKGCVATTDEVISKSGTPVFLSRVWVKDVKEITTTSEMQGQYYIYYTEHEPVEEGEFVWVDHRWHIVRNIISGTSGLMVAECNELEIDCLTEVELVTEGQYNPVTETHETSVSVRIPCIKLNWHDDYKYELAGHEKEAVGDVRLRFRREDADLISLESRLIFDTDEWHVVSISPRKTGAVSVGIRRV